MRCLFILFHHRELSGCGTVAKQERTDDHCYRYGFGIIKERDMNMKETIRDKILNLGADVCGFGGMERFVQAPENFHPTDLYPDCKTVIAVGIALPKGLLCIEPRLIYGHFNADVVHKVDEIVFLAAKIIEKEYDGICVPIPSDGPYEYWEAETMTGKGLLSMKHVAVACGLGQIGKGSLLLNPEYGNRLTLGAILTDLVFESDPLSRNICIPECTKCLDSCPVLAIQDKSVIQKKCRQNTYGNTARGFDTVDCNRCRRECPMRDGL
ncbi:MAG: epoxyqueuosine reductase [Lachnospiraceae bacterium]|nr:epoxyqueuosine reductase [Lachnospiraceae bacterium]